MAAFDPDALLDSIGVPAAASGFDPDSLLDSIGVPAGPKRRRPATLAALDDDGPNSSPPMDRPGDLGVFPPSNEGAKSTRPRRDMSQLGAGLRAAGAAPATTPAPATDSLADVLGLDVMRDTLAGAGRTALNTVKAIPEELNRGTSGVESSLGALARASGQALDRAADKPVFAGPRLPGAQQGLLAPVYHAVADPLKSLGGEVEDIAGRQAEQADFKLKGNPEGDSIISRAVQGVPMLTGLAMTGGAAGATAGMGLLGAGSGLKQAEEAGATPGQAWGAAAFQGGADAALGQIGSIPAIRGLLHGVPVSGAADAVLALAKQAGAGAFQSLGMDVAHGLARKLTYAKDAGLDPSEMAKNAAAQALLQGALEAHGIEMAPRLGGKELPAVPPPPELFHGGKTPLVVDPGFTPPDYVHGSGTGARFGHGLYLTDSPAVASTYGPEVTSVRASPGHQLLDLNQPFTASLWKEFTGARTSRWGDLSPGDRTFLDEVSREGPAAFPTMESFFDFPGLGRPRRVGDPAVITDAIQQRLAAAGYTGLIRKGETGTRADGTPHQEVLLFRPEPGEVAASDPALPPRPPSDGEPPEGGSAPPTLPPPPTGGAAPPPAGAGVAPFRGTWDQFLSSRDMDRGDFAVLNGAGKKALRAEYDAGLDAHREQAAAARAAAALPRLGILGEPEPVHPDVEAAVDAVAPPRLTKEALPVGLLDSLSMSSNAGAFPAEVFGRLVEGKPLRLAKSDLERDVGQAAKGLWPTGLLKSTADVQLLHDTFAQGGDLDAAVAALARNAPQKAQRFEPPAPPGIARDTQGLPGISSGTAVTEAGTEIPFRYRAVSADDLVASHDTALNVNPAYPAELQPRDRGRIASRLQIDRMVNSLDPERLGENRMVSQGAPVVGPDSIVESGNARTIALKRAYASGHPNGAAYASWVRENAPRFGLDPATLPERPVLVRERLGDLGDRAGFAREANAQSLAGMSATEQAGVDAQRLTPELLRQFVPNGSGNVASAGNRDFVRGFLAGIPPHEAAPLVDATGQLSREGQARVHGALLAGAYQDPGLVSRMTEATDDNTRGLSRALAVEAPAFIGLRQGAERGAVHLGLDLGPDIATAANKLSELRASGQKVHDYLAQGGLFGSELSPESQRLLSLFDEFKRSPSRIAETLHRYVELATAAGDPRQASLMPTEPPSKAELLERAARTWGMAGGLLPFEEPSSARRATDAPAAAERPRFDKTLNESLAKIEGISPSARIRLSDQLRDFSHQKLWVGDDQALLEKFREWYTLLPDHEQSWVKSKSGYPEDYYTEPHWWAIAPEEDPVKAAAAEAAHAARVEQERMESAATLWEPVDKTPDDALFEKLTDGGEPVSRDEIRAAGRIPPTPLRPPRKGGPLPLPPLEGGVKPEQVENAWRVVSARYPATSRRIKAIVGEPRSIFGPFAFAAYDEGKIYLPEGESVTADRLFHELTHAAQDARGQLSGYTRSDSSAVHRRVEIPAYLRGAAAEEAERPAILADHLAATVPPEHVAAFVPGDSGAAESPTNATALRETVANTPAVAQTPVAVEGTRGWLLGSALGDQELAHRLASSEDRTLSRLADSLASVAPSLAEAPPELRGYLRQAVDAYANVREEGTRGFPPAGPPVAEDQLRGNFRALPLGRPGLESVADGHQTQLIHRDGSGRPTAYAWYSVDHSGTPRLTDLYRNPEARGALGGSAGLLALLNHLGSIDARLGHPGELELSPDAFRALTRSLDATRLGSTPAGRFLEAARNELVGGPEITRLGRLLGADAPEEVHHLASFLAENAQHPESVAQYLHRVAELHQTNSGAGGEGGLSLSQLLEMAADREQRQAAGSVIPLESSNPVAKSAVTGNPGEAGFVDLRGPRFGEASPIRRWFTREGKFAAMGNEMAGRVKTLVTEKDFQVKATEKRVVANVRDYGAALRDQMEILKHADVAPPGSPIGSDSSIEDVHSYVRAGIMGENDLSAVAPPLQEAAAALRAHLTEQSRAYLQRPDLPASLKAVIGENLDSYFPRTFERISDPKGWAKNLRKDFRTAQETGAPQGESWRISQAADWAQQQNPTMTREDAEGYAFKLLMDDPQAAYAVARGTQAQKAAMGTESRGNLKARLGLPEELDNLLGLHQDPTRSYQIGAMRAARDLATYDLHSKVALMGSADPARPDGLTPDGQRPIFVDRPTPDLPVRIGGKGPLAEKFTSEQVASAIRGTQTISAAHTGFMYYYLKVNGAIKTGKIAMNVPMGVARNMLTWPSLLLAGGHWVEAFPAKYAWETVKTLPLAIEANLGTREGGVLRFAKRLAYSLPLANGETVGDHMFPQGQKLADLRAEVLRKTELGVLGQSTSTDDLRYYTGMEIEPDASSRAGKVIRDLGGIWSGEHDMGKDIVFEAERAGLAKANPDLSPDELDKWARDRMLATTPSRSEVSEGVRAIRAAPGISPFPTFAAERFRNMKNNAMIAWEDLNSTNPQMKVLGAKRAAGLLTALTMAGGGTSWMLQKLWGTVKEDADALREFLPEYLKDHQIAVSDRTGGKIRYADISPLMPLTGVTDPAMALLRGIHQGSTRDGMIDAAQEFARPFLDEEFALKTALDLRGNQQSEGNLFDSATNLARQNPRDTQRRQIYLPGGPPAVVSGQIGKYVWHQDAPAMGLEAERMARATGLLSNTNARGKRYTVADELAALNGVRFNTIDMNAAITGVGYNLKDALTESKRYFTSERSSSQNDPKTVLDARAAANDRWKNAFEIGLKKVAAARQSGIADFAIRQNLRISGVPPLVIGQLMAGRFSTLPLRMPYRAPQDYVGAGSAPAGDEE